MFLIRLCFGFLMIANHGLTKMMNFATLAIDFYDPIGIGHKWSLVLVIFAEVFCSMLIVLGLFTRFAVLPLIISLLVAIFSVHHGINAGAEMALLYITSFVTLLLCGPGRISVDGMMKR